MLYAVIMAGGSGTRFWPRSRRSRPKHHLAIAGQQTMLRQTIQRLEGHVPVEQILLITVRDQVPGTREQLPELPAENIIVEPEGRNTAACVGLAAEVVASRGKDDPTMLILAADHTVETKEDFWRHAQVAIDLASDGRTLVIFGIPPKWGNPGFGYILRGQPFKEADGIRCFDVQHFEEKPCPKLADQYYRDEQHFWNSGMFVWKTSAILRELEQLAPDVFAPLVEIRRAMGSADQGRVLSEQYARIPQRPIDKAVLERSMNVKVVEASFRWDDVGSWQSVPGGQAGDGTGNQVLGEHFGIHTRGCVIAGEPGHLIATYGVSDLIIVQTRDATLVCRREDADKVKELVEGIEKAGRKEYL